MAKKKRRHERIVDPNIERAERRNNLIWQICVGIVAVASLGLLVSLGISSWRVSDSFTVNYTTGKGKAAEERYLRSHTGLYTYIFNDGSLRSTWNVVAQQTCSSSDVAAVANNVREFLSDAGCDNNCERHFRDRCQLYRTLGNNGFAVMGIGLITALSAIGSGLSHVLFRKSFSLLATCWLGGPMALAITLVWWVWSTHDGYRRLMQTSMYPYPNLGIGFFICAGSATVIALMGMVALIASIIQRRRLWHEKRERLQERIAKKAGLDNLEEPPIGLQQVYPPFRPDASRSPYPAPFPMSGPRGAGGMQPAQPFFPPSRAPYSNPSYR